MITINGRPVSHKEVTGSLLITIYESISKGIERENSLLNQRLTWALGISGAYIAAEAFLGASVIRDLSQKGDQAIQGVACCLMAALSISAIVICVTSYLSIEAACEQKDYLRRYYEECRLNGENIFENGMKLPRPFGPRGGQVSGNIAAKIISPVLVLMWVVMTVIEGLAAILFLCQVF
ncbi:MAG: hypothetical protein JO303_18845 [Caulobacteraceae bacterium]|nr:hypothetical protein [Caulobacteraceae bacterium]